MKVDHPNKIIITGPPRSGTTFVLSIIKALGIDIGFSERVTNHKTVKAVGGGLEYLRQHPQRIKFKRSLKKGHDISPRVIKHPVARPVTLRKLFDTIQGRKWKIDICILMSRDVDQVIKSTLYHKKLNGNKKRFKGWVDNEAESWEEVEELWKKRLPLVLAELSIELMSYPTLIIHHPEFARNLEYASEVFRPVLTLLDKTEDEFVEAWKLRQRKERIKIHE